MNVNALKLVELKAPNIDQSCAKISPIEHHLLIFEAPQLQWWKIVFSFFIFNQQGALVGKRRKHFMSVFFHFLRRKNFNDTFFFLKWYWDGIKGTRGGKEYKEKRKIKEPWTLTPKKGWSPKNKNGKILGKTNALFPGPHYIRHDRCWKIGKEEAQATHLIRIRMLTLLGLSALLLKILLFRSHHKLQRVAKRTRHHKTKHLGGH